MLVTRCEEGLQDSRRTTAEIKRRCTQGKADFCQNIRTRVMLSDTVQSSGLEVLQAHMHSDGARNMFFTFSEADLPLYFREDSFGI